MPNVTREELADMLREMENAFLLYEMDCDELAPPHHRSMMRRCDILLSRLDAEKEGSANNG